MADEIYAVPENPLYNPNIRKLQDSDPAQASTIFNPLVQRLIENIAAVKGQADGGDIDCGTFGAEEQVVLHNDTPTAHPLLSVDGNTTAASPQAETLEEHMADPLAHQNIQLDGNMN